MAQVNIYLSGTDREQFSMYAAQFGLDVTALGNLLLARELRVGRLGSLHSRACEERRGEKITAHMSAGKRGEFAALAKQLGLSVSEAGALLVRAELSERWLEKTVDNL